MSRSSAAASSAAAAAAAVGPSAAMDVHSFITSTTALVALERRAEVEEEAGYKGSRSAKELERAGVLLSRLVVTDVATGLYGRCLLTLESARGGPLPQSELGVRDIVELASTSSGGGGGEAGKKTEGGGGAAGGTKVASGVVYRLKESSITLVLDEFLEPAQRVGQLSVLKLANQVSVEHTGTRACKSALRFVSVNLLTDGCCVSFALSLSLSLSLCTARMIATNSVSISSPASSLPLLAPESPPASSVCCIPTWNRSLPHAERSGSLSRTVSMGNRKKQCRTHSMQMMFI